MSWPFVGPYLAKRTKRYATENRGELRVLTTRVSELHVHSWTVFPDSPSHGVQLPNKTSTPETWDE
jgi:hypothetical protein